MTIHYAFVARPNSLKEYLKSPGASTLKNRFPGWGAYQYSIFELRRDLCNSQSLSVIVISASYLNDIADSLEANPRLSNL